MFALYYFCCDYLQEKIRFHWIFAIIEFRISYLILHDQVKHESFKWHLQRQKQQLHLLFMISFIYLFIYLLIYLFVCFFA